MKGIFTRTRIVAGVPIDVGGRRFLPSVMVTTLEKNNEGGIFHVTRQRPISVVEEGVGTRRWHELPDATQNALSRMAAAAFVVAVVGILFILLNHSARR